MKYLQDLIELVFDWLPVTLVFILIMLLGALLVYLSTFKTT